MNTISLKSKVNIIFLLCEKDFHIPDRDRTRTCNPQIRSLMPYPLGHTAAGGRQPEIVVHSRLLRESRIPQRESCEQRKGRILSLYPKEPATSAGGTPPSCHDGEAAAAAVVAAVACARCCKERRRKAAFGPILGYVVEENRISGLVPQVCNFVFYLLKQ